MSKLRKILLFPLGALYFAVTFVRNKLFDWNIFQSTSFDLPIICIGNIAVGGTGKTPHTEYLVRLLEKQYNIAILSRGYGRKTTAYTEATLKSTAEEIGDEPAQYKRKFPNTNVVVENKRVLGVQQILKRNAVTDVILLDDAFQHRAIKAGFNIVITDYNNLLQKDFLMPSGSLRESRQGIKRADAIIVSKCPVDLEVDEQNEIRKNLAYHTPEHIYFTTIKYGRIYNIFDSQLRIENLNNYAVLLVTGIGKPKLLQKHIKTQTKKVSLLSYPDHHNFTNKDIQRIKSDFDNIKDKTKIILTTEKDASRLLNITELKGLPIYSIEIEIEFLNKKNTFNTQIELYVRKNKTNR